jgi:3-methyladenine DNA glycosylase AlkD
MTKYTYLPKEIQQQLHEIKKKIRLKMNGITSDQMKEAGVSYAENFGVSFPELKQMAIGLQPNAVLAQALWHEKIRETMLLATFLHPVERFDENLVEEWLKDITTLELTENISRNLLCRLPFVGTKTTQWMCSDNYWICATGFFTAAFGIDTLTDDQKRQLLQAAKHHRFITEIPVYSAIALFTRKLGSESRETAQRVINELKTFENSSILAEKFVYEELRTDLIYRFGL